MGLDIYEEAAFRLLSLFHFYLCPFPVKWDYPNSKLMLNKPTVKWIPHGLIIVFNWIFGWICLATSVYYRIISPRKDFTRLNAAILVMCSAALLAMGTLVFITFQCRYSLLSGINEIIKITDQLDEEYKAKRKKYQNANKLEGVSFLMAFGLIPAGSVAATGVAMVAILSDFDCTYFIIEEILPDAKHRGMTTIWLILIFRFMFTFFVGAEFCRSALFGTCCVYIIISRADTSLEILFVRVRDAGGFCRYYTYARLLFQKFEKLLTVAVYLGFTIGFWSLVISCWVSIKTTIEAITFPVYFAFVILFIALTLTHAIGLPMICFALDTGECIVHIQRLRAEFAYAKRWTRANKVQLLRVRAVAPVRLKYGMFWVLGKEMLGEYYWLIILRTFDAILVVDFK